MEKLTTRQEHILQIIKQLVAQNGYPPTVREIAEALKKDFNIDVDKKKVLLSETIKVAGCTKVDIRLNEGVMASVQVMVVPKQ